MTTLESNKLIAEFMGFEDCPVRNDKGQQYAYYLPEGFELIKEVETTIEGEWCEVLEYQDYSMVEDLKFHSSYDWLIPVIDKITSLDIYQKYKDEKSSMLTNGEIFINTKYIENTYEQVVDFVKWYNKTTELCHITTNQYLY